jgi:tetratricopeptide (TPR) repeat protein
LEIYNLAYEYITENKSKKELRQILKQTLILNKPIMKEDIFNLCLISSWLVGLREFKATIILCNKILKVDSSNFHAVKLLLGIALHRDDKNQIIFLCNRLLESNYQEYVKELQPTLDSDIPEIKDSIKHVADTFHNVGSIFMENYDFEKAKKAYEIAFHIDPTFFEAHHNIGITLYKLKRYKEAIVSFMHDMEIQKKIKNNYPSLTGYSKLSMEFISRIYFNIGKSLFRMNQLSEAKRYFGLSFHFNPEVQDDARQINKDIAELISALQNDIEL